MDAELLVVGSLVLLALAFDYINGFHDAANSIATVVATRVFDGKLRWMKRPTHGARVRVSIGADEAIARAFHNDSDPELVQLRFERPVAAVRGQPFIVRRYSPPDLLGGGRVTVPEASVRRK